jgi:hypothetical protein
MRSAAQWYQPCKTAHHSFARWPRKGSAAVFCFQHRVRQGFMHATTSPLHLSQNLFNQRCRTWKLQQFYSSLHVSGFAEVGETLELAVEREVKEESGIVVDPHSIQYVSSQPWPFPQSLMIGFMAASAAPDRSCACSLAQKRLQVRCSFCRLYI